MDETILSLACAVLAILFGGMLKGATGMGAPLLAVPVLASLYSVPIALAVMTIPLIASNLWQMWAYRRAEQGRGALRWMLVGCAAGVVLGTLLLDILSEAWLGVGLATIVFIYLAMRIARPGFTLQPEQARSSALPVGMAAGLLQGAVGISGPVSVTFVLAQRLPREAHIFALATMFTVLSVTQVVSLAGVGLMTAELALASLAGLVPISIGLWIGQHIGSRVGQRVFERVTLAVLTLTALTLLAKSVPDLLA